MTSVTVKWEVHDREICLLSPRTFTPSVFSVILAFCLVCFEYFVFKISVCQWRTEY